METEQKEVIRSTFYLQDIVAIFEYGSETFRASAILFLYKYIKVLEFKILIKFKYEKNGHNTDNFTFF